MSEPTISCPKCGAEIKLTESLAAPLVAATRAEFERRLTEKEREAQEKLAAKEADAAAKEKAIREREEAVRRAQETVEARVAERLKADRAAIAAEEARKARAAAAADLEAKTGEVSLLKKTLEENNAKLAAAQKAQAEVMKKERELEDARREMALTVERKVQAELATVREKTRAETEAGAKEALAERERALSEKDLKIAAMKKQLEDVQRRAEQSSPQLTGEVLELHLESMLRMKFPLDRIEEVPKGEFGGDVLQAVRAPTGMECGTILWESKRTKHWSDGWLGKLKDDQRAAKAEAAILISQTLPKEVETFGHVDGVWVADPRYAVPLALALRQGLMAVAAARQASAGQASKMQIVYQYLTGPQFRQRVQGIVEKFTELSDDLRKERKFMTNSWAKREKQIQRVIESTMGMYGDLQGIAGKALPEMEEVRMLEEKGEGMLWGK
jgi:hypothetical protein